MSDEAELRCCACCVLCNSSGKQSLCKLAAYTAGCEVFSISLSRGYNEQSFREDLKLLYNKLGMENKEMTFLFTDQHVAEEGGCACFRHARGFHGDA